MSRKQSRLLKKQSQQAPSLNTQAIRNDGWENVINNLGTRNSRTGTTQFLPNLKLDRVTLTNMYTSNAIARQIVNIVVDDAMRGFINADELLLDELKRLNAKQKITDAATWGRLYGGSALVIFADDGQDMEAPINLERLRKVVSLQIFDRYQVSSMPDDLNQDFYSEHYGCPEVYRVTPKNGQMFRVHRTRMHFFTGERVPLYNASNNEIWDDSILQSCYEPLRNYGQTMNAVAEIVQDFIQTTLSVNGLTQMLIEGNEHMVTTKLKITDLMRSVSNTILLDAEHESYSKHASNVGGLSDIIEKLQEVVCASGKVTMTKLFGVTSKGLGNSGNTDADNDNNTVEAYRSDNIEPCLTWLIDILEAQNEWKDKPESFDWSFPSLKVSNEHEVAKNRLMAAEMDMKYIERGIPVEFLFKKRYSEGGFQTDIFVSEEEMEELFGSMDLGSGDEEPTYKDVTEVQRQLVDEANKRLTSDSQLQSDRESKELFEYKKELEYKKDLLQLKIAKEELNVTKELVKTLRELSNG